MIYPETEHDNSHFKHDGSTSSSLEFDSNSKTFHSDTAKEDSADARQNFKSKSKRENPSHETVPAIGMSSRKTDLLQLLRDCAASTNLKLKQASKENLDDPNFLKE